MDDHHITSELDRFAIPLTGRSTDYDALLAMAERARFVLIGDASHGTAEFYQMRAAITKRLISEGHFVALAVEADWPDAYRVNRYIQGDNTIADSDEALAGFKQFPKWMWRNSEVRDFIDWLAAYNRQSAASEPIEFFGLDLYSLNNSVQEIIAYLQKSDPQAAERARHRYGCFDVNENHPESAASLGVSSGQEREIIAKLIELQQRLFYLAQQGRVPARDEFFSATHNARLIANAEQYYRAMFKGRPSSWNSRDTHMADTLGEVAEYLARKQGKPAKIVVWAHNSHVGDGRATNSSKRGEITFGELVRRYHPGETLLIGFSTYHGSMTAAADWDQPAEHKNLREARPGSVEALFHRMSAKNFMLNLRDHDEMHRLLAEPRLQRSIGVICRPESERHSHYYHVNLPQQFDAIIHIDNTRALTPLSSGDPAKSELRAMEKTT